MTSPQEEPHELPAAVDDDVEKVRQEIRELEAIIAEKRVVLESTEEGRRHAAMSLDEAQQQLREAEEELAAADAELKAAEDEHAALLPQYERCQQNKTLYTAAEELRAEIEKTTAEVRVADATIKTLEAKLQDVSAEYKNERERRGNSYLRIVTQLDELRAAVEEKVALTLPIDDVDDAPNAKECLRGLAEITREREATIGQLKRFANELTAVVEMKRQRSLELSAESERHIAFLKAAKDEEIKGVIAKFQEERAVLQRDIDEVKRINEEQLRALRESKLQYESNTTPTFDSTVSNTTSHHRSREVHATPSEQMLMAKNRDLEEEKKVLLDSVKKASAERSALIKATRDLRSMIAQEEAKYSGLLRNTENRIQTERNAVGTLQKENRKLEEACDALAAAAHARDQAAATGSGRPKA